MYALPEGSPQPSSTTLGSLSFSQELGDKRAQVLSRAQGTENWLGSTGGFHHLPGSTHTALTRTESFTLLGSFWHFLLTTSSRSQLHHCTFPAGGGGQARCSCPQDAVSPGTPTPAGAGRCPQQEAAPGPQVLLGRKCCCTNSPAPLLPIPLCSHCSRSVLLESSGQESSVLQDQNKAAGWGPNPRGRGGWLGTWHPAPHHPAHRRRGAGSAFVLYLAPSLSHKRWRRKDRAHILQSWEQLCCAPVLTAAPELQEEELCEPPAEGCWAGSPCSKVLRI